MIERADREGADWHLVQLGRTRVPNPVRRGTGCEAPERIRVWASAEQGRLTWTESGQASGDGLVYACGPESLLAGLEESARRHGAEDRLVLERFAPRVVAHGPAAPSTCTWPDRA